MRPGFTSVVFVLLLGLASAIVNAASLELTSTVPQATLAPCQQAVFPFNLRTSNGGYVSFTITDVAGLNHSSIPPMFVNGNQQIQVTFLRPCDAQIQDNSGTNTVPFTLTAHQGNERASASSYIYLSPVSSLSVSISQPSLVTCSCGSSRFKVGIKNNGLRAEKGSILPSTNFRYAVSDTSFDLLPGQESVKEVIVEIPCDTLAGVHPFSVGVASEGNLVSYSHSGINVAQCYASELTGPTNAMACHGDTAVVPFTIYNNGLQNQTYSLRTSLGQLSSTQVSIPSHSNYVFQVSLPSPSFPGTYNVSVYADSEKGSQQANLQLTTKLCPGRTVPTIFVNYPQLDVNDSIVVNIGRNTLSLNVHNPYPFNLTNAVFSIPYLGPISGAFNLMPNESKTIQLVIERSVNYSNATEISTELLLQTDQGTNSRPITLVRSTNPLTGYFVLNTFVGEAQIIGLLLFLVLVAVVVYFVNAQNSRNYIVDKEISSELQKTLAKHRR